MRRRQYLSPQLIDGGEVAGVVSASAGSLLLVELSDLQLQLLVGRLQGAHLHTQPDG